MARHSTPPGDASSPDVRMTDDAIAEFLQTTGDGVLTLHTGEPQSFPVSFGYDAATDRCVFQLLTTADSGKHDLGEATRATLVAYEVESPDDWTSVVATGMLTRIPTPDAERRRTYAEQATAVGMSVFDSDPTELDATWYELRDADASGRRSP